MFCIILCTDAYFRFLVKINMRKIIYLICVFTSLLCNLNGSSQQVQTQLKPNIAVLCSLNKDSFRIGEKIVVRIQLKNNTDTLQSVWFQKLSTGSPSLTSVKIANKETGESIVRYESRGRFSSQLYTADQIKILSTNLNPEESICQECDLKNLVEFKDSVINSGVYELYVISNGNESNRVNFKIY